MRISPGFAIFLLRQIRLRIFDLSERVFHQRQIIAGLELRQVLFGELHGVLAEVRRELCHISLERGDRGRLQDFVSRQARIFHEGESRVLQILSSSYRWPHPP